MQWLADRLAQIPGVVAIVLGGSRAQGTHRADSDWDLYYRGSLDPNQMRALGYPGTIVAPGDWAYPMNGGAWLTVEGEKVDILYRDLDHVERWIDRSERGEWEIYRVPGYVSGMPSYAVVGELALAKVLHGSLPKPKFPTKLRETAPRRWRWEADFALEHASAHARDGDLVPCFAKVSFAILAIAHARLAACGEWALNEKRMVQRAGLEDAAAIVNGLQRDLPELVTRIKSMIAPQEAGG